MSADRKKAHIDLALQSQTGLSEKDQRFNYEPLLSAHPGGALKPFEFLGKTMRAPVWVSSMTGGTEAAVVINRNLARACQEFGLGMGLGSCRILLEENKHPDHFFLKEYIGNEVPFYANLGIAQIEQALTRKSVDKILEMINRIQADGLIIHINPLQEWLQPEGEIIKRPPIEVIAEFISQVNLRVVVKEVGQGMGPESLRQLMALPLQAVDFGAFGGTNFAKLELHRNTPVQQQMFEPISHVGNDAYEMLETINQTVARNPAVATREIIISGGIKTFLDGYYFIRKSSLPAIYGQASSFLKFARDDYDTLREYVQYQLKGLEMAYAYLTLKENPS